MPEDMFRQFKEHSVAEFFKKNRQMLGFTGKVRSMTIIVHEFCTNSLDACEEASILPEIFVQIEALDKDGDHYRITIKDNGPGIPKSHLGKALGQMLAGTKFHRYIQQRGQQGIGAAACTMFSYITTGKKLRAISAYDGTRLTADIEIDFKTNSAIVEEISTEPTLETGLGISAEFREVKYERSNHGVYEYLRRTALANPHCTITLIEPDNNSVVFPRSAMENPQKPFEIKPHPLGIGTHDLLEFARRTSKENKKTSMFLMNTFARVSAGKVEEIRVLIPDVDLSKRPEDLSWEDAEKIVKTFGQLKWIAPAMDSLVPISKTRIETSFKNIFNPEIIAVTERSPRVYRGGIPFMVEAGIAYGGGLVNAEKRGEIMRYANRVPLLFDTSGCAITETIKSIDWKRYDVKNFDEEPIAVLVNLVSVHVPYTSAGKQAISNEEDIMIEIKNAVMEASRTVQRYLSGKRKAGDIANKRKVISRYIHQISSDLSTLSGEKETEIEAKLVRIVEEKYATEFVAEEEGPPSDPNADPGTGKPVQETGKPEVEERDDES